MESNIYLDAPALSAAARKKLEQALYGLSEGDDLSAELMCVSEEEIRSLNARMRGVDRVTDVLSFPSMDNIYGTPVYAEEHGECVDEDGRVFLGSVVVCEARAREQAREYGHSYEREFFYLAVHGILHCLGYDHETEEEKRVMRGQEERVMARLDLRRDA